MSEPVTGVDAGVAQLVRRLCPGPRAAAVVRLLLQQLTLWALINLHPGDATAVTWVWWAGLVLVTAGSCWDLARVVKAEHPESSPPR